MHKRFSLVLVVAGVIAPLVAFYVFFTHESFTLAGDRPVYVDRTPELVAVIATPLLSVLMFVAAGRLSRQR
jgi:hypothetical protein